MAYLDVSPMTVALRTAPDQFEINHGWLHHIPSDHDFMFDGNGHVQIRAQCNCAMLAVHSQQEGPLYSAYREWHGEYWHPMQVNREFASHFAPPSAFRRMLIRLTGGLHRWLLRVGHRHHHQDTGAMMPAE
ncbi:MAG TPA: hypothetical protein VE224_04065 [Pseudolabrys sp.]|nr:hypothetical protein [Pseudolabrys sp.]